MGKYVLYPTVVEPARSAKRFSRGNNFKGTGVFSFEMHLLRHFGFFSAGLRLFVGLGSVYRTMPQFFEKVFESGENPDLDNRKRKQFLSICSAKTTARDAVLTLEYAWCFPLSKAVFIVWIRHPSPEKSIFLWTQSENQKKNIMPLRKLKSVHSCNTPMRYLFITLFAYVQQTYSTISYEQGGN